MVFYATQCPRNKKKFIKKIENFKKQNICGWVMAVDVREESFKRDKKYYLFIKHFHSIFCC